MTSTGLGDGACARDEQRGEIKMSACLRVSLMRSRVGRGKLKVAVDWSKIDINWSKKGITG